MNTREALRQQLEKEARTMRLLRIKGKRFVLRPVKRQGRFPNPDFLGTGLALTAILKPNQSLAYYRELWISRRLHQQKT